MSKRLNPQWKQKIENELDEVYKTNKHWEKIETEPLCKKFIVIQLIKRNIPYKTFNMGAGVTKITNDTTICPKCKGLGKL